MTRVLAHFGKTLTLLFLSIVFSACSGGGGGDSVVPSTDSAVPAVAIPTANFRLESVLARSVPRAVDRFRITGFDSTGVVRYGPVFRDKAPVVLCEGVRVDVSRVQVEYLTDSTVIGLASVSVQLRAGETFTCVDPPFSDLEAALDSLTISPSTTTLAAGTEVKLRAVGRYTDGTTADLSRSVGWSSSSPVASVDQTGLVRGVTAGSSVVTVSFGTIFASSAVVVTDAVPVELSLDIQPPSIAKGTSSQLTVMARFSDGSRQEVTSQANLTSGAPNVASVEGGASLLGRAVGTTTVTASFAGLSDSAVLTVTDAVLTRLRLSSSGLSLPKGTSASVTATGVFSDQSEQDLTLDVAWSSTDTVVAAANQGVIRGLSVGTTVVIVSLGDIRAELPVETTPAVATGLRLTIAKSIIAVGETTRVAAIATFSDQTELEVNAETAFTAEPADILEVETLGQNRGFVLGVGAGEAIISGDFRNFRAEASVEVTAAAATLVDLRVEPARAVSSPNTTRNYKAIGILSDGEEIDLTQEVSWASSNSTLVAVSNQTGEKGQATMLGQRLEQSYTITAQHPDLAEAASAELIVNTFALTGHFGDIAGMARDVATGVVNVTSRTSTGDRVAGMALNSAGTRAYVANTNGNSVDVYSVDLMSGALTLIPGSRRAAGTKPNHLTLDPKGRFVYVCNTGTVGTNRGISGYKISDDGTLETIPGSNYDGPRQYIRSVVDPTGNFLYAIWYSSLGRDINGLRVFSIDQASGSLSLVSEYETGQTPSDLVVAPDGGAVFVSDLFDNNVAAFVVSDAGATLTPASGSPFSAGDRCEQIVMHPSGRYLYAVNASDQTVTQFAIDTATRALTSRGNVTSSSPNSASIDSTGRFFYVMSQFDADNLPNDVTCFQIDPLTGALGNPVEVDSGNQPVVMVVSP